MVCIRFRAVSVAPHIFAIEDLRSLSGNILHIHSALICCGVPVMAGVAVYAVAVIVCKTIKKEDCMLLPKGEKIAKLLHL